MPTRPNSEDNTATPDAEATTWAWQGFVLKTTERQLLQDGAALPLGARAFDLLLALVQRRHRVASRDELIEAVWPGLVVEENNLSVQINALRKALGVHAVATVPGRGYQLTLPLQQPAMPAAAATPLTPASLPAPLVGYLPTPAVPLLGREAELAALARNLSTHALTTLVGAGGIGKTLLALHAARQRMGAEADGAWWVDLATLPAASTADDLARTVASAIGLQLAAGLTPTAGLARALRPMAALVLLDNAEHVVASAAGLLAELLAAAPGVRWLVTSQAPLKVAAEQVQALGALAVPPLGTPLDLALSYGALSLLNRSAHSASSRYVLTAAELPAAIEICQRLDGIALALEMAASRLPSMGADALNQRLAKNLRALAAGHRGAPSRQQTLQATLLWSHDLLTPAEQQVLQHLGVFVGGFTLDAAQQVARTGNGDDEWAVLDALAALVDKSWVQVDGGAPPRYRLLESARLFALEQLVAAGGEAAARDRHAQAMAALGDRHAQVHWHQSTDSWARSYLEEVANLDAAFHWALHENRAELACRIFLALPDAMKGGSRTGELPQRAAAVRPLLAPEAAVDGVSPLLAARVCAGMAVCLAPFALQEALALTRRALDQVPAGPDGVLLRHFILTHRSQYLSWAAESAQALQTATEARALIQAPWPPRLLFHQLAAEAFTGIFGEQPPEMALARLQEMITLAEAHGMSDAAIMAKVNRLAAASRLNRDADVVTWSDELLPLLAAPNRLAQRTIALVNRVGACVNLERLDLARHAAVQALPLVRQVGFRQPLLVNWLELTLKEGRLPLAAQLLGHFDTWVAAQGVALPAENGRVVATVLKSLEQALGADTVAGWRARGAGLSGEQMDALLTAPR